MKLRLVNPLVENYSLQAGYIRFKEIIVHSYVLTEDKRNLFTRK